MCLHDYFESFCMKKKDLRKYICKATTKVIKTIKCILWVSLNLLTRNMHYSKQRLSSFGWYFIFLEIPFEAPFCPWHTAATQNQILLNKTFMLTITLRESGFELIQLALSTQKLFIKWCWFYTKPYLFFKRCSGKGFKQETSRYPRKCHTNFT